MIGKGRGRGGGAPLTIILAFMLSMIITAPVQAQLGPFDNSDGCGSARAAVAIGRDNIKRDRFYKESDRWFQDKLQALQKCVDDAPRLRAAAAEAEQRWQSHAEETATQATRLLWLVLAAGFPLAFLLSYCQSAGVAGNGAMVRWRDWKGSPIFIWSALAGMSVGYQLFTAQVAADGYMTRGIVKFLLLFALVGLGCVTAGLAWRFVRDDLWSTLKGIFILGHYMIVSHPVQLHLPTHATTPIARRDFGRAMREHGVGLQSFWVELVTPSFVRRHKLERAAQVHAQLHADTGILKAAMERESTRAAYTDTRGGR